MDYQTLLPFIVQAVGGLVGGNILGLLTRGGGGPMGRTLVGALGGLAAGYAAQHVPAVADVAANWGHLAAGETGAHLSNFVTGAAGGGILGLVTGLLIRPKD